MNKQRHAGMFGLAAAALVAMFAFGANTFVNQVPGSELSSFGMYAIAFATGVWSTLAVLFVVNYVSVRQWGRQAIRLDPRFR